MPNDIEEFKDRNTITANIDPETVDRCRRRVAIFAVC